MLPAGIPAQTALVSPPQVLQAASADGTLDNQTPSSPPVQQPSISPTQPSSSRPAPQPGMPPINLL